MVRLPPCHTRTDTLFPSPTLCLSTVAAGGEDWGPHRQPRRRRGGVVDLPEPGARPRRRRQRHRGNAEIVEDRRRPLHPPDVEQAEGRSEEHTSELQSLMRISYAVFCLKKKNKNTKRILNHPT